MAFVRNVLGGPLEPCCMEPLTGFYRNGRCDTGPEDGGAHVVCARMTEPFLAYSRSAGNDLSTPVPEQGFSGLEPGDCWCLGASRWKEAFDAGTAPPIVLKSTHEDVLRFTTLDELVEHAVDIS